VFASSIERCDAFLESIRGKKSLISIEISNLVAAKRYGPAATLTALRSQGAARQFKSRFMSPWPIYDEGIRAHLTHIKYLTAL
jgi:hypothetical protein